jgi:DNA gyrase subunit A
MQVSDLRVMGRATQGVRLINIKGNDSIAAVTKVMREEEEILDIDAVIVDGDGSDQIASNLSSEDSETDSSDENTETQE